MASDGGASSISVAVRVRPFNDKERQQLNAAYNAGPTLFNSDPTALTATPTTPQPPRLVTGAGGIRKALKVLDERILVFDPPETNPSSYSKPAQNQPPVMGKKVKDIRFCFDRVFDEECDQEQVYEGTAKELVGHVMNGFHSTVFAYGATGCGKTHTISGNESQPGIVFLIMKDLFQRIAAKASDTEFSLTVSYLEIYNETIRDLLEPERGVLQLRESKGMATPAGLSSKEPTSALDVVEWITVGNQNRTVNATEANATSSRSHAVLQVTVTQKPKAGGLTDTQSSATLSIIDLAGSERASVTKNKGERLIEGANINRSLLALGNCINALCDPKRRGHVPYRDSKLTRLLKPSLGGNCKTVMIVCVSPSSAHYDETHNTLQYANRAKEIKTKAIRNVISVDRHVAQYCQQIMQQAEQIDLLKKQLAAQTMSNASEDREQDSRAVAGARVRLMSSWESGKERMVNGERAKAELEIVDALALALHQWKAGVTTYPFEGTASPIMARINSPCESMLESMDMTASRLKMEASMSHGAMDLYHSTASSAAASLKTCRPGALSAFELEIKVLENRLAADVSKAREDGLREGLKAQTKVMQALFDASRMVSQAISNSSETEREPLQRLAHAVGEASAHLLSALLLGNTGYNLGTKRPSGMRTPLEHEDLSAKAPRLATASALAFNTSSPMLARANVPTFAKRSPRKNVAFPVRGRLSKSPKKRKEVQWRDETGDGWELEDVKYRSPATPDDVEESVTTTQPSPGPKTRLWTASSTLAGSSAASVAAEMMALKARSSSVTGTLRSKTLAPLGAPRLPRVSEVVDPTFFARPLEAATSMPPPPVPVSARVPLVDLANTSLSSTSSGETSFSGTSHSMAGTKSGLVAPVAPSSVVRPSSALTPRKAAAAAARRRISHIGPLRSAKPSRRTSYIPPTPSSTATMADGSLLTGASSGVIGSGIASSVFSTRKANRIPGGASPSLSVVPGSVRRSPRKLASTSSSGPRMSLLTLTAQKPMTTIKSTTTMRRASVLQPLRNSSPNALNNAGAQRSTGTGAALANGVLPTAIIGGFGAKSAARIAARRESSLAAAGGTTTTNKETVVKARTSLEGVTIGKKDSPASTGLKPAHWR
ncbi:tubulin-dependent ATPase kip3 [Microbotryomycetes sp. JL201]|nr:tubulin-dependent ATPase kip3 [Microbotryomycetes sp. JL201]